MSRETHTGGRPATSGVIPGDFALSVGNPNTPCPDGWKWVQLTDIARLETGHTPSREHPEYWDGDIPWIGIRDATENHGKILKDTKQHTNQLGIDNSSARLLPALTVCLSRTASVGFVVVMGIPMATSQDFVNWVCGKELHYLFLKYVLLLEKDALLRFASGTTHQTVYFPEVKAFHICLPPLPTQKAIAHILGTLDDKIELLRSMNETLEAMARALFKSWFIDFDPVRKKAEGQPTGLPPEIDTLFPDSFEDSELGEIPKGWRVGKLNDLVAQRIERVEASEETAKKPYLPIDCITSHCLFLSDTKAGSEAQTSLTSFHTGDIIFGAMRPYFHKVCIAPFDGTTRTTAFVLYPIETESYAFSVLTLHSDSTIEYATTHSTGTTIPYASWKNSMENMPTILPNKNIVRTYNAMVRPMLEKIRTSHFHYEVVVKVRDLLLPRLISGDLELTDEMISKILEPAK